MPAKPTEEPEKRKPIRMGEVALAMATRPHAEPTTDIEVNRSTTNGRWGFKVSVTLHDADAAYAKAKELAERAAADFPYVENGAPAVHAVKPAARRA